MTIVVQDAGFGNGFCFRVVFGLQGRTEDGVDFIGVCEGGEGVVDDGRGGCVDECFDGTDF